MKDYILEATSSTPRVELKVSPAVMLLEGACYPENAVGFFGSIMDWLKEFTTEVRKPLELNVRLEYFNTSSSKCLLDLFEAMEEYRAEGGEVVINWHYCEDDEDILESGEEFSEDLSVPFNLISY
jgi:hypothetical protein